MQGYLGENNANFLNHINEMTLKHYQRNDNLVVDIKGHDTKTLEDILLGLDDIKAIGEKEFGRFDNIDIVLH